MPIKQSEKRIRHRKIENILCLMVVMLAMIGIVVLSIDFRVSVKKLHINGLEESVEVDTEHKLFDANSLINEMVGQLEYIAQEVNKYDDFANYSSINPNVEELLKYANTSQTFDYIGVADAEGKGFDDHKNVVNIADREYFKQAMQGQVSFSEVMESKLFKNEKVQIIAHPVRTQDGEVRGIVYGVLNIADLERYLHKSHDDNDDVAIVDSCGSYILQYRNKETNFANQNFWSDLEDTTLKGRTIEELQADFENRKQGSFTYMNGDEQRFACYMPIGPNKWQLIYSVSSSDTEEIVQQVYGLKTQNALMAACCHVLLIACIIWYFKRINAELRSAQQDAQRNMEFMQIAIEHSDHTVFEYDYKNGKIQLKTNLENKLLQNAVITNVPESIIAKHIIEADSVPVFEKLFDTIRHESSSHADIQVINVPEKIWYRISMNNIYDEHGAIVDTLGIVEDITEQKKNEAAIKRKLQIQETLISNALLYAKVDMYTDTLLELNGKEVQIPFQEFLYDQIHYKVYKAHIPYVEQSLSLESLNEAYQQGKESVEIQYMMKNGAENIWVSCVMYRMYTDDSATMLMVVTDIDEKKRREIALKEQAERDGLTGLYNAATTRSKIDEILLAEQGLKENQFFVLIDLDNFKLINDTFGHGYGDKVLVDVATILNKRFRSSDIIGRLGGDEFIVMLRNMKSIDYADDLMQELCNSIRRTYRQGDQEVTISASIGVAIAPKDGNTFEELYQKSDHAQYQIKKENKNGYKRYQ